MLQRANPLNAKQLANLELINEARTLSCYDVQYNYGQNNRPDGVRIHVDLGAQSAANPLPSVHLADEDIVAFNHAALNKTIINFLSKRNMRFEVWLYCCGRSTWHKHPFCVVLLELRPLQYTHMLVGPERIAPRLQPQPAPPGLTYDSLRLHLQALLRLPRSPRLWQGIKVPVQFQAVPPTIDEETTSTDTLRQAYTSDSLSMHCAVVLPNRQAIPWNGIGYHRAANPAEMDVDEPVPHVPRNYDWLHVGHPATSASSQTYASSQTPTHTSAQASSSSSSSYASSSNAYGANNAFPYLHSGTTTEASNASSFAESEPDSMEDFIDNGGSLVDSICASLSSLWGDGDEDEEMDSA